MDQEGTQGKPPQGHGPIPYEIAYVRNQLNKIHQPPPGSLFHYTNAAGFHGIIASGKLWASHTDYVNDTQELRYATSLILQRLSERIDEGGATVDRLDLIRERYTADIAARRLTADTYVVCFCERGDLLSQWRAYAAGGQGFSVGFSPRRLTNSVQSESDLRIASKLFRVLYDLREQLELVDFAIDQVVSAFETNGESDVIRTLPLAFSDMAFCFKHPAFSEEREWRLVFVAQPSMERFIHVRESAGRLLPYAAIPVCEPDQRQPYDEIFHGPTLDAKATTKAVKTLLGKVSPKYWQDISVSGADAPLR